MDKIKFYFYCCRWRLAGRRIWQTIYDKVSGHILKSQTRPIDLIRFLCIELKLDCNGGPCRGISLKKEGNLICISLSCKLVPVQYREYGYGLGPQDWDFIVVRQNCDTVKPIYITWTIFCFLMWSKSASHLLHAWVWSSLVITWTVELDKILSFVYQLLPKWVFRIVEISNNKLDIFIYLLKFGSSSLTNRDICPTSSDERPRVQGWYLSSWQDFDLY